jgi:copper chaperone CopZ
MRDTVRTTFAVPSIDCASCARSIQAALGAVEGIREVDVDISARQVNVDYDAGRLDEAGIRDALEGAGFAVGEP